MDPSLLTKILIVSIPILVAASRFATQWLKVRAEQRALGATDRELEQRIEQLGRANADVLQRLENIEAIVVSQTWDALHEPGLSETDLQRRLAAARPHEAQTPDLEERNRQRAAALASRLGG